MRNGTGAAAGRGRTLALACVALQALACVALLGGAACSTRGRSDGAASASASAPASADADASVDAGANASANAKANANAGADAIAAVDSGEGEGGACSAGMVLVEGEYCPVVEHVCLHWLDPPGPYHDYRCGAYKHPAQCSAPREKKRFCIDREEYVAPGETLPVANTSWTSAGEICATRGARLCLESEWQFACEGPDMHPYPYGDGFTRDGKACNIDRSDLGMPGSGLKDLRAPAADFPRCVSPFGVHDMSGNVEEWTTLDKGKAPDRSSMKGAWWLPGKNTCRAATIGHGEVYQGKQVGARCCRDAR